MALILGSSSVHPHDGRQVRFLSRFSIFQGLAGRKIFLVFFRASHSDRLARSHRRRWATPTRGAGFL